MARNFTPKNPSLPITYGQSRAIRMLAGNPAYYADKEAKTLTPFSEAVAKLTMGEAHSILEAQEVPAKLMALAGKAATKVAPKTVAKAKGKAAAKHVAATPAATKPKAAPATKASPSDDTRLFSIQSSIESIREHQEAQAESLKGIAAKLGNVESRIQHIEEHQQHTSIALQAFSTMLDALKPKTRTRKPKADAA